MIQPEFIFKALSDSQRLAVLDLLQDGELCACHIMDALDIAQSKLSYHVKILSEAGLINARPEGKWVHYSINQEGFNNAQIFLTRYATGGAGTVGAKIARKRRITCS